MPTPHSVVERLDAVTGPFAYVRLLGDRAAVDALTPTLAPLVEGNEQPFLGALDVRDGRGLADHVLVHDGSFGGLAGDLVVVLQGHDQHRVRVLPEFHQVGHAADDAAVGGLAEVVLLTGPWVKTNLS
jgi:hypothetical protein